MATAPDEDTGTNASWRVYIVLIMGVACGQRDESPGNPPAASRGTSAVTSVEPAEPAVHHPAPTSYPATEAGSATKPADRRMTRVASRAAAKDLECDGKEYNLNAKELVVVQGTLTPSKTSDAYRRTREAFVNGKREQIIWRLQEAPSICFKVPANSGVEPSEGLKVELTVEIPDCRDRVVVGCREVPVTKLTSLK